MITGNIRDIDKYVSVHKDFEKVFAYLKSVTPETSGRVDLGEHMWVTTSETETTPEGPRFFEAHRNYLDIQYIVSGSESFGYANVNTLTTATEYNPEKDIEMLSGDINPLVLKEGDFCIVFPEDAHIPVLEKLSDRLVRAVGKVKCTE